jgi:heavy metal sensor kinase
MRFTRSIRWRLQVWHGIILLAVLGGFGFTAWKLQQQRVMKSLEERMHERHMHVLRVLRDTRPSREEGRGYGTGPARREEVPPREAARSNLAAMQAEISGTPESVAVWWRDGELLAGTNPGASPRDAGLPPQQPRLLLKGSSLEIVSSTPPGEVVRIMRDVSAELADLSSTAWQLAVAGAGVLALGLAGGWWAAGRSLRPIATMSATAERLSAGNLGERIPVPDRGDELGWLAATLNAMLKRLDVSFAQQTRFISDAAHELRTPVTVLLTQTQSALRRERPAEEYRQSLEASQRAAERMRHLIESLLALARLDAGDQPMKRLRFDLGRATAEQMELLAPLAAARGITLQIELIALTVEGDPDYLSLVIANLLTNAIHYNKDGGNVVITLRQEGDAVLLSVADTGEGMAPDTVGRIFDRFYRADQSRSLPAGRTGLGLAITKSIVEAHGGTITVDSKQGAGSTFTVCLPLPKAEPLPAA